MRAGLKALQTTSTCPKTYNLKSARHHANDENKFLCCNHLHSLTLLACLSEHGCVAEMWYEQYFLRNLWVGGSFTVRLATDLPNASNLKDGDSKGSSPGGES
jgi:hypothetical protein